VIDRDPTYVEHIAQAVRAIDTYLDGVSEEAFHESPMIRDAVLRNLEVISEASRRLSSALKDRYPSVPWRDVRDSGNVYRHEYERVNDDLVWETATTGLESLRDLIQHEISP
jgi:uncharacterized protein with HEPN domain